MKKFVTVILICIFAFSINVHADNVYRPYPGYVMSTARTGYDSNVVTVQQHLQMLGYSLSADGYFGTTTKNNVIWFQQDVNTTRSYQGRTDLLTVDGKVGLYTWNALINDTIE